MPEGPINRTLHVLTVLCETGAQTLTSLANRTGLSPPTVLRILRIMRDEDFVTQDANREWRATLTMWRLGCAVIHERGFGVEIDRVLRDLSAQLDETVVYAAYADGWISYVAESEPVRIVRTSVPIGGRFSPFDTVTGRAVLAALGEAELTALMDKHDVSSPARHVDDLEQVRALGYAIGEGGRSWPGVWAAAHVVSGRAGQVAGAVAVVCPVSRTPSDIEAVVTTLRDAAGRIGAALGGAGQ